MKKYLMMVVAVLAVLAMTMPAFAKVDFTYGGQFRTRIFGQNNFFDGNDDIDDNTFRIDQRFRLYFNFVASENLKAVVKFEMGDVIWGGYGTGGRVGADERIIELKNAYVEFNIPCTIPQLSGVVGIQGIALMNAWIIDDDFSAAVLKSKFDPWGLPLGVSAGYIATQNNTSGFSDLGFRENTFTGEDLDIDSWFLSVDYTGGPLTASLVGYYQYGHNTIVSANPATLTTPVPGVVTDRGYGFALDPGTGFGIPLEANYFGRRARAEDNNLFDVGLQVGYKLDWMSAYIAGVKNFGGVDLFIDTDNVGGFDTKNEADYQGWMVDAGASFFCGPYTFNVGGFYTTGPDNLNDNGNIDVTSDINWFTYPLATSKYFSEIMGGGILDNEAPARYSSDAFWRGYGFPTNIWTLTAGAAWQVLPTTKISASYWYFSTSEDVAAAPDNDGNGIADDFANDLGHEIDLYISQDIVGGLKLDLVGAYMFTGDAYSTGEDDDDAYELGARLQWNF